MGKTTDDEVAYARDGLYTHDDGCATGTYITCDDDYYAYTMRTSMDGWTS